MGNSMLHPLHYYYKTLEEAVPNPYLWKSGIFTFKRSGSLAGWPTLYGELKTPVTVDVLEAGLILAAVMVAFCFLIILPGVRGGKPKLFFCLRVYISIFLGASCILCNWGQEWEVGEIHTETQYKAFSTEPINADISIKIGLRNVNITLKADEDSEKRTGEKINYNERFWWSFPWHQGRIGFGPYAAEVSQEFRAAQTKGLPYPILWIAEYFTLDGEGIRWGRHYRTAGWYTHIMCWAAFPCWILANICFFMNPKYGGLMLFLMGVFMLIGNILWSSIRNSNPLIIPFESAKLETHFGWSFVLNCFTGMVAALLGGFIYLCWTFQILTDEISIFFGLDPAKDLEEFYTPEEEKQSGGADAAVAETSINGDGARTTVHFSDQVARPQFRKRGVTTKLSAKPKARPHVPPRRQIPEEISEEVPYENVDRNVKLREVQLEEKA